MELFRLMGSILIDDKDALKSLSKIEKEAKANAAQFKQLGADAVNAGKIIATGIAVAATAATALVVKFADVTSEISDNSKKVNMSAKEYQKWTYAAKQSGLEQETLLAMMKKQQTAFAKATTGNKAMAESYAKLGINIAEWTSEEAFEQVILKLSTLKDETQQNALANEIFGKSYADLLPLLKEGADGINKLRQRAEELGIVISEEDVAAGDKFGDTLDDLKSIFGAIGMQLAAELLPYFQEFSDWILDHKEDIKKFATEVITKLGEGLKIVANWLFNIIKDKDKAKEALDNIKSFIVFLTSGAVIAALATHPLFAIVGAISTLLAFKDQFAELYNNMTPQQKTITMLGALALAVGGVLVAATGGAAAIPIGAGMLALAAAVALVIGKAESTKATTESAWKPQNAQQISASSWQYGSNQIASGYGSQATQADTIAGAVVKGLKTVKVVLDKGQVGEFVDNRIIYGSGR